MKTSLIIGAVSMCLLNEAFSMKAKELIQKSHKEAPSNEVTIEVIGNKVSTDKKGDIHLEDTHGNVWDIGHDLK